MLVCWSLYELCCLCVVDGDETRCPSRRDLSSLLLASCLFIFSDPSWHVTDCRPCTSWSVNVTTALKLRTIFVRQSVRPMFADCEVPVRILFMLCHQILRSTTWAADLSPPPDESTVHMSLTLWYRLHTHNSVKYLAVRTRRCHCACFDVWPWCLSLILRVCYTYEVQDSLQQWDVKPCSFN